VTLSIFVVRRLKKVSAKRAYSSEVTFSLWGIGKWWRTKYDEAHWHLLNDVTPGHFFSLLFSAFFFFFVLVHFFATQATLQPLIITLLPPLPTGVRVKGSLKILTSHILEKRSSSPVRSYL
jgi:hypothetical protein